MSRRPEVLNVRVFWQGISHTRIKIKIDECASSNDVRMERTKLETSLGEMRVSHFPVQKHVFWGKW